MLRSRARCLLLFSLLSAMPALAVDKTIVVLPMDVTKTAGKLGPEARASLEDQLRDEASNALSGSGWTVMTGETTIKILTDNGIDPTRCGEGSCHLDTAKQMNVEKFISGAVQHFEGVYTASVRLIDTRTGNILASVRIESETVRGLSREFAKKSEKFFEKSGLLGDTAGPGPAAPNRAAEEKAPVAAARGTLKVVSTPPGARVLIDGDAAGTTPLTRTLDAGTYVITIEIAGFAPATRTAEVKGDRAVVVNEKLVAAAGAIDVSVSPEPAGKNARVTIDGATARLGKQGGFKVGPHLVRAESSGYKPAEQRIEVENGGTASAALVLEGLPGKVVVSVNVDSQCEAGGPAVRATPSSVGVLPAAPGSVHVTCTRDGYEPAGADVNVEPGKATAVSIVLVKPSAPRPVAASAPRIAEPPDDGPSTLGDLMLVKKTVVQVKDNYVAPERIKPRAMVLAALRQLAQRSRGAVRVEGSDDAPALIAGTRKMELAISGVDSIWQVPAFLREANLFVLANVPPGDPVAKGSLAEIAEANGLLSTLDPYSYLMPPDVYAKMKAGSSGEFGGLGFVMARVSDRLVLTKVLRGTPADRAGVKKGAVILSIAGKTTAGLELDDAVALLRGKPGTRVDLVVQQGAVKSSLQLVRELVQVSPVENSRLLDGKVGWIRLSRFSGTARRDLDAALGKLAGEAGGELKGVVLDLRGNAGGLLEQAVQVADAFIAEGTIVTTVGVNNTLNEPRLAHSGDVPWEFLPVAVLIDQDSAAAAEIVAGALRARGRAVLLGRTSFGKGSVQVLYDFKDEKTSAVSALKLSIAQYLGGGTEAFDQAGFAPDLELLPSGRPPENPPLRTLPAVGKPLASLRYEPADDETAGPDAVVRLAGELLASSPSASRERLVIDLAALAERKAGTTLTAR